MQPVKFSVYFSTTGGDVQMGVVRFTSNSRSCSGKRRCVSSRVERVVRATATSSTHGIEYRYGLYGATGHGTRSYT